MKTDSKTKPRDFLLDALILQGLSEADLETCEQIALGNELIDDHTALYHKLYEMWLPEMPYGTAKARTGDPYLWVTDRLCEIFAETVTGGSFDTERQ